jgi:signal transduction histidine kinase
MSDVVLSIAAELSVEPVLQRIVAAARDLVGARYAALGVPDADGDGFARFLTVGMSQELIERIGPLPRRHGLLGAMLGDRVSYRTDDITADPRFEWWPAAHPRMRSFLGVPIVSRGDVIGALYLTDKEGGFDDADQRLIELLAAHAAIAIENARLYELSRELSVTEERNRLARELHDSMSQQLFSLVLTAETALNLVRTDPERAEGELRTVKELARATMAELRSLIFELRPATLAAEGLVATVRHHAEVLGRVHGVPVEVSVAGARRLDPARELALHRVVQEALHNALQHAAASRVAVDLDLAGDPLTVTVADDGIGFDPDAPGLRSRRLGLTSMRERARALGGSLVLDTAPGRGTTVRLRVPAEPPR